MVRGGKRENSGRKSPGDKPIKLFSRVSEELDKQIDEFGIGETKSDKIRFVIEKGIEKIKESKE